MAEANVWAGVFLISVMTLVIRVRPWVMGRIVVGLWYRSRGIRGLVRNDISHRNTYCEALG